MTSTTIKVFCISICVIGIKLIMNSFLHVIKSMDQLHIELIIAHCKLYIFNQSHIANCNCKLTNENDDVV